MSRAPLVLSLLAIVSCYSADPPEGSGPEGDGKGDSSAIATILDFEFDGTLVYSGFAIPSDRIIRQQLLYTIGHLNGNRSVGRLDKVQLSNVEVTALADGSKSVTYHAVMPVAWGSRTNLPESYELTLPRDVSLGALEDFTAKYGESCAT